MSDTIFMALAGCAAGAVNGLFGAGGGMVLVPLLGCGERLDESERFPTSVAIIAPVCLVSLLVSARWQVPLQKILPYLIGGCLGGIAAGIWGKRIPTLWLHRIFGILILWGGIRYLC